MVQLKIGNTVLKNNLILGPMAGVTDLPFRLLCAQQGAGMVCMEMVSAKGIYYHNKNTEALLAVDDREHPVALQFFGADPVIMSEMAKKLKTAHSIFWISIWDALYQKSSITAKARHL